MLQRSRTLLLALGLLPTLQLAGCDEPVDIDDMDEDAEFIDDSFDAKAGPDEAPQTIEQCGFYDVNGAYYYKNCSTAMNKIGYTLWWGAPQDRTACLYPGQTGLLAFGGLQITNARVISETSCN